jgi:hypothetical protein
VHSSNFKNRRNKYLWFALPILKIVGLKTKKIQRIKDGTASIILIMQAKDKIITSAGLTMVQK